MPAIILFLYLETHSCNQPFIAVVKWCFRHASKAAWLSNTINPPMTFAKRQAHGGAASSASLRFLAGMKNCLVAMVLSRICLNSNPATTVSGREDRLRRRASRQWSDQAIVKPPWQGQAACAFPPVRPKHKRFLAVSRRLLCEGFS